MIRPTARILVSLLSVASILVGCGKSSPAPGETDAYAGEGAIASNRVAIPPSVRSNLGITFASVKPRHVAQTLRVPGRFELMPTARREYRTMLPGRIELRVDQFDRVEAGDTLYTIDSPAWRDLQQQLSEAKWAIARLATKLETFGPLMEAHARHEENLAENVEIWSERVTQLESVREAGGGRLNELAEARSSLTAARAEFSDLREKDAELNAARAETEAELAAARSREELLLDTMSAILGVTNAALEERIDSGHAGHPRWRATDRIEVRADETGVVESMGLTNGAWADQKIAVLTVVRPDQLRFHALGLQSDLGVLRDGLPARIVPPTPTRAGSAIDLESTMAGALSLGLSGDPSARTVDLYCRPASLEPWARPGVSAHLEIVIDETASPMLAIPLGAVQRDGLSAVIFRRDPKDPNQAIRIEADLGIDDGRWVSVLSGLAPGDEVVLDGAFQLMLATSGSIQQGGHFHADGTFHEEAH
jgi:multidrug efflux pump subunit AcrA (membrane-fusion protein)